MGLPVVERVADKLGVGPLVAFQRACDRYPQRCKVQRTQSWITETGFGQLGHLLPMVFEMRLICPLNIILHLLGTREMQDMCFFALFVFNCCRHNRCHWCCDCNDRSLTDILPPTLPATHNKIFLTCWSVIDMLVHGIRYCPSEQELSHGRTRSPK